MGLLCLLCTCTGQESPKTCILSGEIVDHKIDTILLTKGLEFDTGLEIKIPVNNNSFTYELNISECEAYALVFPDEPFYQNLFFPDGGLIEFKLHTMLRASENKISGGKLNQMYYSRYNQFLDDFNTKCQPYNDSIDVLLKEGNYFTDSTNLQTTPKATALREQSFKIMEEISAWRYDYEGFEYSVPAYYWFIINIQDPSNENPNINQLKKDYSIFLKKHSDHPYNSIVENLLDGLDNIKIGGTFIDFTLPDIEGNQIRLSDEIKSKIALIDLWASWCGPCIENSRTMIPIFKEFVGKGFTIVGVAGEFNNTDALRKRMAKEKFPWINLVELNNQNGIWDKYGVSNSGGGTILVDEKGEILAINPTASEVKKLLIELL